MEEHLDGSLKVFLGCRKWSTAEHRVLPWTGGWMDWDFQETREHEWLEELVEETKSGIERRDEARKKAKDFYGM